MIKKFLFIIFVSNLIYFSNINLSFANDCREKYLSESQLENLANDYWYKGNDKEFFECSVIGHKKGFEELSLNLVYAYKNGIHVDININKAISILEELINKGNILALTELAYILDVGLDGSKTDFKRALKLYKKAIRLNEPWAMYNLAIIYWEGVKVKQNKDESIRLYRLAAEQNHGLSLNNLAYMYEHGEYFEKDLDKAYEYYKKAADTGEILAIRNLAKCYRDGNCAPEQNFIKAEELMLKAIEAGEITEGYYDLAQLYEYQLNDFEKSLEYYKLSADNGYAEAQYDLAYIYDFAQNVEENNKEALKYYKLAAEQGLAKAYHAIGYLYEGGQKGIGKNMKKALKNYQIAADMNYEDSYYNMSFIYSNGSGGVKIDNHKAVRLLKKCMKDINAAICINGLAYYYANGQGVKQNDKEAIRLYELAIEQNYIDSYGNLAWHYQNGYGVKKDIDEALKLYTKGAELNDGYSQAQLGWHYENGDGVTKDLSKAYYYYKLAAKNNDDFGEESLKKIIEKYPYLATEEEYNVADASESNADTNQWITYEPENETVNIEEEINEGGGWIKKKSKTESKKIETEELNNQISSEEDSKIQLDPIESYYKITRTTSIRQSPDSNSKRIKIVNKDEIYYIPGKHIDSNWYAIENENGVKIGYIYETSIEAIEDKSPADDDKDEYKDIDWGNYYALIIANNNYNNFDTLKTPIEDAKELSNILENKYGFKTEVLKNATRDKILDKLFEYRSTIKPNDNLLIYYAGHGGKDEISGEGYWYPIGSQADRPSSWISNSEIITSLRGIKNAKHMLVIVDSCFSGALFDTAYRSDGSNIETLPESKLDLQKFYEVKSNKKARVGMTSGNEHPVPDSIGNSNHSPFAKSLIDILDDNDRILLSNHLFIRLETYLTKYSNFQETLYDYLPMIEEHNFGGHFIFVPTD